MSLYEAQDPPGEANVLKEAVLASMCDIERPDSFGRIAVVCLVEGKVMTWKVQGVADIVGKILPSDIGQHCYIDVDTLLGNPKVFKLRLYPTAL